MCICCIYAYSNIYTCIYKYRYIYVHMYMYVVICAYIYVYIFPPDEQTSLAVFLAASPSICAVKTEEVL